MAPRNPRFIKTPRFKMEENLQITVHTAINDFIDNDSEVKLDFPASLTNEQRGYIHEYVRNKGLKSKSIGKDAERHIVIYKRTNNSIVDTTATFEMTPACRKTCHIFLQKNPLLAQETEELCNFARSNKRTATGSKFRCSIGTQHHICVPPMSRSSDALLNSRQNLPIFAYRQHIIEIVAANQVVVISGDTGSGKTTQVPQYLLEEHAQTGQRCRIICTQPRRLAAISIADRVAHERGESVGQTIGYQIRLESRISQSSNLIYTTSGFLLRCLIGGTQRELFNSVTHIILDEVHERDKFTDFLLIAIKEALRENPSLKIILMSATLDSDVFTTYFGGCPLIDIPGRMFPVELYNLESTLGLIGYKNDRVTHFKKMMKSVDTSSTAASGSNFTMGYPAATVTPTNVPANQPPIHLDKDMQEFVDEVLEECFLSNREDSFSQFFYLVSGEAVPVDAKHSQTQMSALMIAATNGHINIVQTLIGLGANPLIVGGYDMNAIQWANHMERTECAEFLLSVSQPAAVAETTQFNLLTQQHNQALLQAYQGATNEQEIDSNLVFRVIKYVHSTKPAGSILVFLPGYDSIVELNDTIAGFINAKELDGNVSILMLHGSMQPQDQKRVFAPAEYGHRKIILSTNISETSLTIDDVVYVIDTGKVKQKTFDALTGATSLTATWISQACAKQRMGRAGRVRPGVCFRLYSQLRFESLERFTLPEILRVPLTEISLSAKILAGRESIAEFLEKAIQPPPSTSVSQSIKLLKRIGALDEQEHITELGTLLVDLPVDVQLGKTLLYSVMLRCLDPVLTIVSALSVKDPFVLPGFESEQLARQSRKTFAADSFSDHMVLLKVFQLWNESRSLKQDRQFCRDNFISNGSMQMICGVRMQILGHLRSIGLIQHRAPGSIHELNRHSCNWAMVKACLTAGMYPNVCRIDRTAGQLKSRQINKLMPHKSSVLRNKNPKTWQEDLRNLPTEWVMFGENSRAGRICMVRYNTIVSPLNVALFAGPLYLPASNLVPFCDDSDSEEEDAPDGRDAAEMTRYIVDDWISFVLKTDDAYYIHHLRQKFNALLLKIVQHPNKCCVSSADSKCIDAIASMLQMDDKYCKLQQPAGVGQRPIGVKLNLGSDLQYGILNSDKQNSSTSSNNGRPAKEPKEKAGASHQNFRDPKHAPPQQHHQPFRQAQASLESSSTARSGSSRNNKEHKGQSVSSRQDFMEAGPSQLYNLQQHHRKHAAEVTLPRPTVVKVDINTASARFFVIHADSEQQVVHHFQCPMKWFWSNDILQQLILTNFRLPTIEVLLFFYIPMQQRFFGVGRFRSNPLTYQTDALSLKTVMNSKLKQIWFKPANGRQTTTFDQSEDGEEITDRKAAKLLLEMLMS